MAALIHLNVLSFMGFTPSLLVYWKYVVYTGLIALLTGIVAGLYPAWYMTSFPPALVLKGNGCVQYSSASSTSFRSP